MADFLYATGDRSPNDGAQNGFHVDPNYPVGILLFQQVMAAQTARGTSTAADTKLIGIPSADLERIATRGSATNTASFSPRLRYRPIAGLEAYGGPLFAFAVVENADPFNTQVAGGSPRSALDGRSGRYLGTELDLGIRYRPGLDPRSRADVRRRGGHASARERARVRRRRGHARGPRWPLDGASSLLKLCGP